MSDVVTRSDQLDDRVMKFRRRTGDRHPALVPALFVALAILALLSTILLWRTADQARTLRKERNEKAAALAQVEALTSQQAELHKRLADTTDPAQKEVISGQLEDLTDQTQRAVEGQAGVAGAPGLPGLDGVAGAPGDLGPMGATGRDGGIGSRGDMGLRGERGDVGPRGERGEAGPMGERGERGDVGPTGPPGPPGEPAPTTTTTAPTPTTTTTTQPSAGQGVFGPPLSREALSLSSFADRAVPLPAIVTVVGMPFWAMSFAGVAGTNRLGFSQSVFPSGRHPKVLGVNAGPLSACVIDDHARRDVAVDVPVRDSVGSPAISAQVEGPVAIPVETAGPYQAGPHPLCLRDEAISFVVSERHGITVTARRGVAKWFSDRANAPVLGRNR